MKKFISILMTLLILSTFAVVSTSALDAAETSVSFNKGDEIVYSLKLTVPEKVVGCDFSVYYDSSMLKVKEVADYTGNFDPDEYQAVINPNLKDEIIGNWSILSGVSFDNRSFVTVKFEAVASGESNISYYVRYMYPASMEQFTDYTFKCDVKVNGKKVIDNEAPELNVDETQSQGLFVNSVTGDSEDADVNTAQDAQNTNNGSSNGGDLSENDVDNNDKTTENKNNSSNTTNSDKKDDKKDATKAQSNSDKDADVDTKTDAEADATQAVNDNSSTADTAATPSQTNEGGSIFTSVWFWAVIVIALAGGGACLFYFKKNKKA